MPIYEFEGIKPVVNSTAYVHPTAVLIGDVIIGARCYVGPGAVMRGDLGRLTLCDGANLQDGCIVHSFPEKNVMIAENAHIGHGAVLHGCAIGRNAMVGMNAVIMDNADIGEESFVAALTFVKAGMHVEPRTLVGGIPAKYMRDLTDDEIEWKSVGTRYYQYLTERYNTTAKEVKPLTEIEADRGRIPVWKHDPKHEQ